MLNGVLEKTEIDNSSLLMNAAYVPSTVLTLHIHIHTHMYIYSSFSSHNNLMFYYISPNYR